MPAPPVDPKRDPTRRPPTLPVNPTGIPEDLRALRQWVRWRWMWDAKRGAWTKVPIHPKRNKKASTAMSQTWGSFEEALAGVGTDGTDGVGFVFAADDPYCGIDLDACRDAVTGDVNARATAIIDAFASYAEVSVSGTGVHIIVRAALPGGAGHKRGLLEIYDRLRYFATSGIVLGGRRAD